MSETVIFHLFTLFRVLAFCLPNSIHQPSKQLNYGLRIIIFSIDEFLAHTKSFRKNDFLMIKRTLHDAKTILLNFEGVKITLIRLFSVPSILKHKITIKTYFQWIRTWTIIMHSGYYNNNQCGHETRISIDSKLHINRTIYIFLSIMVFLIKCPVIRTL